MVAELLDGRENALADRLADTPGSFATPTALASNCSNAT